MSGVPSRPNDSEIVRCSKSSARLRISCVSTLLLACCKSFRSIVKEGKTRIWIGFDPLPRVPTGLVAILQLWALGILSLALGA